MDIKFLVLLQMAPMGTRHHLYRDSGITVIERRLQLQRHEGRSTRTAAVLTTSFNTDNDGGFVEPYYYRKLNKSVLSASFLDTTFDSFTEHFRMLYLGGTYLQNKNKS